MATKPKTWLGSTICDFCGKECEDHLFDAKTKHGPWATMCMDDWIKNRISTNLGTGIGQHYEFDGADWVKIEG